MTYLFVSYMFQTDVMNYGDALITTDNPSRKNIKNLIRKNYCNPNSDTKIILTSINFLTKKQYQLLMGV